MFEGQIPGNLIVVFAVGGELDEEEESFRVEKLKLEHDERLSKVDELRVEATDTPAGGGARLQRLQEAFRVIKLTDP